MPYETMNRLSAQMVEAAAANDWDRLARLEQEVARLREALQAARVSATLTAEQRSRKFALIMRILANDAEVRRHTEPWMEQVRRFLDGSATKLELQRPFGAAGNL